MVSRRGRSPLTRTLETLQNGLNFMKMAFKIHKLALRSLFIGLCFTKILHAAHFHYAKFYLVKHWPSKTAESTPVWGKFKISKIVFILNSRRSYFPHDHAWFPLREDLQSCKCDKYGLRMIPLTQHFYTGYQLDYTCII